MKIGVPAETRPGETRVAATAETVKKLVAGKHEVLVSRAPACRPDRRGLRRGGRHHRRARRRARRRHGAEGARAAADELALMKRGAVLVGMLEPFNATKASPR
jgi:H+-translocating NAD(P) transhydrogenase subunit alpha